MMGRSQREKGKRGERLLAATLREAFPEFADVIERGWQSRGAEKGEQDVHFPAIWWEHKFGKMPNPRAALAQAICDCQGKKIPIAVIRENRKVPCAFLRLDDLLLLIRDGMSILRKAHSDRHNQVLPASSGRQVLRGGGGRRWRARVHRGSAGDAASRDRTNGKVHRDSGPGRVGKAARRKQPR